MRRYLWVAALAISAVSQAQKMPDPRTFANSITADDLKRHLYIVAGKEMEGRETATDGERKAAGYIENQFRSLGLAPGNNGSYQMMWPLFRDSLVNASLEVNGTAYAIDKDFAVNLGTSHTSSLMGSEVVFVGFGLSDSARDDYKGLNARGKIVLILAGNAPAPTGGRRGGFGGIYEAAMKNGAAAVLQVATNFPRRGSTTRSGLYTNAYRTVNPPNVFAISEQIAEAIMGADYAAAKEAMKNGTAQGKIYRANVQMAFAKATNKIESSNVVGVVEGTDKKDEYVFITAHYDHEGKRGDSVIYYGADDDGSGTVSVIELAEAFAKAKAAGKGPRRTIVFMTVSGEERGLLGSAYYSEHPIFPLDKTTVDLNIDMIGRIDPKRKNGDSTNYVYVVGDDKLSSDLRTISEAMNKKYIKMELDYKYNDPNDRERIYYRSDHYNFARKGVPIIFYFNGTHNDYHRPTDTPDKIQYDLMMKRARLIFYTAWEMANRNDMLKRDIPLDTPAGG
jgi:hypothetical protein